MKKLILIFVAIATLACFSACNCNQKACTSDEVATTNENLQTAITGESNASAKYALISEEAHNQGQHGVAAMFAAASQAEAIHVQNHTLVLNDLGETIEVVAEPQIGNDLEELLQGAIEGETYEFTEMYPPMIEQANKEDIADALRTFTYAKKAEENHAKLYAETLELLKAGKSDEIAKIWYVCPICGNLFNTVDGYEICAICGVNKSTFISFEK
jgi:rubrerythrin